MPRRYENNVNREQDLCVMAVHKETGKFFGGKGNGTHVGYSKKHYLKSAITNAGRTHDDYYYVSISFDNRGLPTLTLLEGSPEGLLNPVPKEGNE